MTAPALAERVRAALDYDPLTGVLTWRWRADLRPNDNARLAGKVAGCVGKYGYRLVRFEGRLYRASRLAWLHVHGEWPEGRLDHRNGERAEDWIENLRPATPSQNAANSRAHRDNRSGFKGVSRDKRRERWAANICCAGQRFRLGTFDAPEAAHAAYAEAAHELFGEFARAA